MRIVAQSLILTVLLGSSVIAATLDDLDFMTGRWESSTSNGVAEEWWMAAGGNTKVAAFRWAIDDRVIAIELVVISKEEDGIYLRFKHFGADYVPWEKDEPNIYRLQRAEKNEAYFAKVSDNDKVPNVMIYRLTGDGLEFRGTNNKDGTPGDADLVIRFRRVD